MDQSARRCDFRFDQVLASAIYDAHCTRLQFAVRLSSLSFSLLICLRCIPHNILI